jgi:hypothetical protein
VLTYVPVHIAPSLTTLNPRSEICFCRSLFNSFGSYQGSDLMTELIPRKSRIRPNSSTKCPLDGSMWIRDNVDPLLASNTVRIMKTLVMVIKNEYTMMLMKCILSLSLSHTHTLIHTKTR